VAFTDLYEICSLPDDNCYTCWNGYPTNPGDICVRLSSFRANATSTAFAVSTIIPNNDVVIAAASSPPPRIAECLLDQT